MRSVNMLLLFKYITVSQSSLKLSLWHIFNGMSLEWGSMETLESNIFNEVNSLGFFSTPILTFYSQPSFQNIA